ncbi:hypothetical protein SPB21_11845 [Leptothoe sp. ISB3NOV94-8A]
MKISIDSLQQCTEVLFNHLKELGIDSIELDEDFYWEIVDDNRYNPYEQPKEFSLGELSSDWKNLEKIVAGEEEPIGYGFVWLSSLVKLLGKKKPT